MNIKIEDLNQETIDLFNDKINSLKDNEDLNIYLYSNGGDKIVSEYIVEIIKKQSLIRKITIYLGLACSCRLILDSFEKFKFNIQKNNINTPLLFLSDKENKKYLNGEDIRLSSKRLKEIFN